MNLQFPREIAVVPGELQRQKGFRDRERGGHLGSPRDLGERLQPRLDVGAWQEAGRRSAWALASRAVRTTVVNKSASPIPIWATVGTTGAPSLADRPAGRLQDGMRIAREVVVEMRRSRTRPSVIGAARVETEAIEDDEQDSTSHRRIEPRFLMKISGLVDWAALDGYWPTLYGTTGKPSRDPLVCFKMLLLEQWYKLPDPEEAALRVRYPGCMTAQRLRGDLFARCEVLSERAADDGALFAVRGERAVVDALRDQVDQAGGQR